MSSRGEGTSTESDLAVGVLLSATRPTLEEIQQATRILRRRRRGSVLPSWLWRMLA